MNANLKIIRISIKHEVSKRKSYFKEYFMLIMETVLNQCSCSLDIVLFIFC